MARSTTLARLTLETARWHGRIDEALFGSLEFPTAAGYRRFLSMIYGFQAPLETALVTTKNIDLEQLEPRGKAGRLASDLMQLGLTRHEHAVLAHRPNVGPFSSVGEAYGWMYTTERLMLHVEALRVRLEIEMPVVTSLAHKFLYAYAGIAELRWRQFGAMLDRVGRLHGSDVILDGAHAGMEALHGWLARHVPNTRAVTNDDIIEAPALERATA